MPPPQLHQCRDFFYYRRSSIHGTPTHGIGGMLNNSSILQTSHVLEQTASHLIEAYGSTLPVAVAEILTISEKSSDVSVCISPNGWAWLVHGRRLVIWRYTRGNLTSVQATGRATFSSVSASCRELSLPPSDLAHNAKLVNVFAVNENQTPSCIAASPEGIIRYWPSIAHEGSSQETSADLQGQECCLLTDVQPVGSVLATTTSTIVLVQRPESSAAMPGGQHALTCRLLKPPQGILGGIGRRVSLLWSGISTVAGTESKLVQVLGNGTNKDDPTEKVVYVLTSNSFQKWLLAQGDPDRMFYNCDLENIGKQAFATHIWAQENVDPSWVRVWLMDMALAGNGKVAVLMAAHNPNISQELHYAIGILKTATDSPPIQFRSFHTLNHSMPYSEADGSSNNIAMKLLLPSSTSYQLAYGLSGSNVLCASLKDMNEPEKISFGPGTNVILGTGYALETEKPLLFTLSHGMVALSPIAPLSGADEFKTGTPSNLSMSTDNTYVDERNYRQISDSLNLSMSQAGLDNLTMSESKKDQLKAAFLLYCKRNINEAKYIVDHLFPPEESSGSHLGTNDTYPSLDRLVISMSTDLIDDLPASDPRWLETLPASELAAGGQSTEGSSGIDGIGSSSLVILHQLEDKQTALDVYISFLKEVGLWQKLTCVPTREMSTATTFLLNEHSEKTVAAITLRTLHSENSKIIDRAIKLCLNDRTLGGVDKKLLLNLTPQDHFYREISKVHEIFTGFQRLIEKDLLVSNKNHQDCVLDAISSNEVIMAVLRECLTYRARKERELSINADHKNEFSSKFEHAPWTCAPGPSPNGLRSLLIQQFQIILEKIVPLAEDASVRNVLFKQLIDLSDFILDGYQTQLRSAPTQERQIAVQKEFEKDRTSMILPLVNSGGCFDEATRLAEKYHEFQGLIRICEMTNDNERLEQYMDKFSEHDFANFVFDWHLRQGKQSKLLQQRAYTSGKRQNQLGRFLEGHANISWLHDIQTGDYQESAKTLKTLADSEVDSLSRKKTMLSIAKLANLCADSDDNDKNLSDSLSVIDHEMNIISAQEQLPKSILEAYGFESDKMKVLSPRHLIELYISEENHGADQVDFKKALDLLDYLPPSGGTPEEIKKDRDELKLRIWASAVSRNDWSEMQTADPLESIKETVFFKLADDCYLQGLDLTTEMPSAEELLSYKSLKDCNANVRFLIQTGYEHINRQLLQSEG